MNETTLVVDLDGSLLHTDMLHELFLKLMREKPHKLLQVPFWLFQGKAVFKQKISQNITIDPSMLPYNIELIEWLIEQEKLGRQLVLCTASDLSIATSIANHLGIFAEVMASDGKINLAGIEKSNALTKKFGLNNFDYVGNSFTDLAVWTNARKGIVVNGSNYLVDLASKLTEIEFIIPKKKNNLNDWMKVLRVHQWVKNCLLFIPLLASHTIITKELSWQLSLAFLAFSFCASSVYITNDLFDLENDRKHLRKRFRSFACGAIPIWKGVALAPILMTISIVIGQNVDGNFLAWLLIYFSLTFAYSSFIKQFVLLDCLVLSFLYTLRIIAGASVTNVQLSFWLLAFSIFLFLSLAYVKRYAELHHSSQGIEVIKLYGRGYLTTDSMLIQQLGVSSGYISAVVLALYLNSETVIEQYKSPQIIWGAIPLLLLWLSRMWLMAHRGLMHDDPIIFAIKDKISMLIGACFIAIFVYAALL